jgi:hypothetical protein
MVSPRIRRFLTWACVVGVLLSAVIYAPSLRVRYATVGRVTMGLDAGRLVVYVVRTPSDARAYTNEIFLSQYGRWPPIRTLRYSGGFHALVEAWVPMLVFAGLAAILHIRRPRAHECPYCRYDLRGTPAVRPCPECGCVQGH